MPVIIFILVLVALILAHEFGHFLVAKATGMRVDEFGIGLPPKIIGWKPKKGETEYSLNWLPFGGFVHIWGEDSEDDSLSNNKAMLARKFGNRPKWAQVVTLFAGVCMNAVVAWLLLSIAFMSGLPMSLSEVPEGANVASPSMTIISVVPNSPAETAGILSGDILLALATKDTALQDPQSAEDVSTFIATRTGETIDVLYRRGEVTASTPVIPTGGILEGRGAIGINMDMVGTVKLGFFSSLWYGLKATGVLLVGIAVGFGSLIVGLTNGTTSLASVSGPIGIAGMFSNATEFGLAYVLSFVAFISANLAVLNLLPFPALDGGRIIFVIIEAIKRSPIKPVVANTLNAIGFMLLLALMVLVTWQDIARLL